MKSAYMVTEKERMAIIHKEDRKLRLNLMSIKDVDELDGKGTQEGL